MPLRASLLRGFTCTQEWSTLEGIKTNTTCRQNIMRIGLILSLALLFGCAGPQVKPLSLPVELVDQQTTQFPPSPQEIIHHPRLLAEVIAQLGSTVTGPRKSEVLTFIHQSMEGLGDFSYIPTLDIQAQLKAPEFLGFAPHSVVDTLKLGRALNSEFVSQVDIQIVESRLKEGEDQFKAQIQLALFSVSTGQLIFKENILYDSAAPARSKRKFKHLIQSNFPLKGFIIETRGAREVAKITLGSTLGLNIGRKVSIRSREVKHQLIRGVDKTLVSYSAESLATGEVIQVSTNDAWIWIPKAKRSQFKTGDLVFTLPETSHSIF